MAQRHIAATEHASSRASGLSFIIYPPGFPPIREGVQHDWGRWIGNESTIKSSEIFLKGVECTAK
jgi:hypothetical protein